LLWRLTKAEVSAETKVAADPNTKLTNKGLKSNMVGSILVLLLLFFILLDW